MSMLKINNYRYDVNTKEWIIPINEVEHRISYIDRGKETREIIVDGELIEIPKSSMLFFFNHFEHKLVIDGKTLYCVWNGKEFDVAINDRLIRSWQRYFPAKPFLIFALLQLLGWVFLFINEVTIKSGFWGVILFSAIMGGAVWFLYYVQRLTD